MSNQSAPASLRIANPVSTVEGAEDSLQAINTTELPDGAVVLCSENHAFYELRKASGATASGDEIVAPAQGGPGRWYSMGHGAVFHQDVAVVYPAVPPQSGIDTGTIDVLGVVDGDVIASVIADTGIPAGLIIGLPRISGPNHTIWHMYNPGAATIAGGTVNLTVAVLPA